MKYLFVVLFIFVGCGEQPDKTNKTTIDRFGLKEICLNGIAYYYGGNQLAPKVSGNRHFVRCK